MNKKNQGIEVKLSVIAISAILVASLFVMGSSRFIPDAMAQNFTDQIGGATNQTGAAAGGATNATGAAAGGATNATGAAAGGATNATGAMVMIPQAAMTSMMDDLTTVRGAVDEGDTEAVDALDNVEMQLRTAAGLPPAETDTADEGDTDTADEGDTDTADEGDTDTADEGDTDTADEDTTDEDEGTTTGGGG
jgi:hypothetical protein